MRSVYIITGIFIIIMAAVACSSKKQTKQQQGEQVTKAQTYTCPMHPQVIREQPGTCPICGMDLVLYDKNNKDAFLTIGAEQQQLANISTMTVGDTSFAGSTQLYGRLVTDPAANAAISARVAGRIENLYVKQVGEQVRKGMPLYRIYAEQLLVLQQEYLVAHAQVENFPGDVTFVRIEQAARQKLLLYGQEDAQLQQLLKRRKTDPYVMYYAPANGVVSELLVTEGQYVQEGSSLMRLEDYTQIWVEAVVYASEIDRIKTGQQLKVTVEGWENEPQMMEVQFVNPVLETNRQQMLLRGVLKNKNGQWQPGLQASIWLSAPGKQQQIVLPVDAVLRDGNGRHVWVETEKDRFEPRYITTAEETDEQVVIAEGLQAGDKVVVTGAYLLYSEYILKKGQHPVAGHMH